MKKLLTGIGAGFVLVLGVAAPAWAHVEPSIEEGPAGGFVTFTLYVGHGCEDDSPTTKLEVQMPDGVEEVTPQFLPGWEASVDDSDGLVVTWEGGPLPHDQYQQFGLSLALPDTPGETAMFPTIQTCESGASTSWTQATPEGGEEPEHPAPAIAVTEATGDEHGHDAAAEEGHDDATETDSADAAATESHDDDGGTDSLAVVALIVGALGLLAGSYAVLSSRRSS